VFNEHFNGISMGFNGMEWDYNPLNIYICLVGGAITILKI
jgi:hypothetical protein